MPARWSAGCSMGFSWPTRQEFTTLGGGPQAALRHATQTRVNDPLLLISAVAAATEHLGFGVTVTLSYEPPFPFARRMSRSTILPTAASAGTSSRAISTVPPREWAKAGSASTITAMRLPKTTCRWSISYGKEAADHAVVADATNGIFTRPERVRKVHHDGPHYKLDALHISEPSPQRTPEFYQAGSSPAGRAFARATRNALSSPAHRKR